MEPRRTVPEVHAEWVALTCRQTFLERRPRTALRRLELISIAFRLSQLEEETDEILRGIEAGIARTSMMRRAARALTLVEARRVAATPVEEDDFDLAL